MTFSKPPRARERSRDGLSALDWTVAPSESEAWPDKLRIAVKGTVRWGENQSYASYVRALTGSRYLQAAPTVGRHFRAQVRCGLGVTGKLRLTMMPGRRADEVGAGGAGVEFVLNLNPTATRALATRRNPDSSLDGLSVRQFFDPVATPAEAFHEGAFGNPDEIALDRSENVLLSVRELGGSYSDARGKARNRFLGTYESKLRALIMAMLAPPVSKNLDETAFGEVDISLNWGGLIVQQAELYFERSAPDPVAVVRRLHDRAFDLARRLKGQTFPSTIGLGGKPIPLSFSVEQDDGYPHLILPLTGTRNIELSIYAKTNRRIRFEVRYKKSFGHELRGCSTSEDRLASLLLRLSANAAKRLPWVSLSAAVQVPPHVDVADVPDLVEALVDNTARTPALFGPVVRQLLLTGGVIANEERFPGITKAIRKLEKAGILFRWTVQQKETRSNRRYGLTERYAAVRLRMIAGFAPIEPFRDADSHVLDLDHYELNAELMGGRQWVEKPYV